jgi:hypothetical protein
LFNILSDNYNIWTSGIFDQFRTLGSSPIGKYMDMEGRRKGDRQEERKKGERKEGKRKE